MKDTEQKKAICNLRTCDIWISILSMLAISIFPLYMLAQIEFLSLTGLLPFGKMFRSLTPLKARFSMSFKLRKNNHG